MEKEEEEFGKLDSLRFEPEVFCKENQESHDQLLFCVSRQICTSSFNKSVCLITLQSYDGVSIQALHNFRIMLHYSHIYDLIRNRF